jgi:UDP-N-acetylmuramate--alanine ligase
MEEVATTTNWTKIFSDYGHVASSLKIGWQTLKEKFPEKNIICIFQPHQIHRILQGRNEFPKALATYNQTFIYDIYAAREDFDESTKNFHPDNYKQPTNINELGEIFAQHCKSTYLKTFNEVEKIIEKAGANDIIVIYSAGDIDYYLRKYLKLI